MKILIAEDDTVSRRFLQVLIERLGHECLAAEDGNIAWHLFQNHEIDVVISDWMMPGLDGLEFCARVRAHVRSAYTYFIFLTALSDKDNVILGIKAGADDYLPKPLNRAELEIRLIVASRITVLYRQLASQREELERLNKQLFDEGHRDSLTQLGNRLRLSEDLDVLYARVKRYNQSYCAIMCDIDRFKLYNDTFGHLAGDEVLRQVAVSMLKGCRSGDAVYRYGGEEFLFILPEQSLQSASIAGERLRKSIEELALVHPGNPPLNVVTLSVGIAMLNNADGKTIQLWLKGADTALYRAKQSGRNQVCVFNSAELEPPEDYQL